MATAQLPQGAARITTYRDLQQYAQAFARHKRPDPVPAPGTARSTGSSPWSRPSTSRRARRSSGKPGAC